MPAPVPAWEGRRRADALRRVRADGARHRKPCVLCGKPIDYSLRYPHPQSCTVEHLKPRATHPELTWDPGNHAPAHLVCNQKKIGHTPAKPKSWTEFIDVGPTSPW